MAALEDDAYATTPQVFDPASAAVSASPSALEGEDSLADYGAGGDETAAPSAEELTASDYALARRPAHRPRLRSERMQALIEQTRQMIAERAAASGGDSTAALRAVSSDPSLLQEYSSNLGDPLTLETAPPPKQEEGWGQIFSRGLLRANEAVKQGKDVAEGKKPRDSSTPPAEYEQPLELSDFASPATAAKKLWFGLAQSYPAVAASVVGSTAGTAVGGPVGGIVGGAAGMGLGSALMEIGPAYHAELQQTPDDVDGAWDRAMVTVAKSGAVGAASMALFGAGKPLSNALKSLLTPVVEGAAKPVAGIPLRAGVQAIGQPAISAGGQAAENVAEGKPITTNLDQAVAGGLANVVPDVVASVGGRVGNRILRGKPGVNPDQELALAQTQPTQGELPLDRPMVNPSGQGELPLPPPDNLPPPRDNVPPPPDNRPPPQDNLPPPQDNLPPPQDNLPPPPNRPPPNVPLPPIPDTMGVETNLRGDPTAPPMSETSGPPPRDNAPPPRAAPVVGETIVPDDMAAQTNLGPASPLPRVEPSPSPPGLRAPVTGPESFGRGGREEPPPPPPPTEPVPPPRPQPFPPTERPVEQRPTRPEDFTVGTPPTHVEPDDLDASRSVAKNAGGDVIGKGASPEEALADARARNGEPYRPENIEPVQEAPPAAAGTEPAASVGRDTVPETPAQTVAEAPPLTKTEEVKAEAAATRAEKKAAAEAVKAKIAADAEAAAQAKTEVTGRTEKVAPTTRSKPYVTPGEAADVTSRPAEPTRLLGKSTSTPVSRGARAEMDKLSGKGAARDVPQPLPGERAPVGTNVSDRVAPYLVDKVLNREMSVAQAHEAYGVQKEVGEEGRGPGAPRQHRDLASYLRDALKRADDPTIEAKLKETLAGIAERAKGKITPNVRAELAAATKQLDALLAHEQNVKARRAEHQAILDELEGGGPPSPESRVPDRAGQAAAYKAARPEVNEPLVRRLEGAGGKLHGYLDDIINSQLARALVPQHVALAQTLKRILPSLEVVNKDLGDRVYGQYNPTTGTLELNAKAIREAPSAGAVTTLLHEGLHGATVDYVHRLFTTPESGLSAREVAHKTALRAISDEIYRVVNDHGIPMTEMERRSTGYATREYAGGAPHEIITQVFTEPGVQRVLSQTKASPQLKAMLDSVGLGSRGVSSLWDAFKRTIRQIFGLPGNDSILDHIMRPLADITEMGGHYRAEMVKARAETLKANREVLNTPIAERTALSMENLRSAGRTVGDKLDTVWRTGLRGAFQGATTSAIHDFIKHLTPSVTDHRTALENVTHASEAERVRKITTRGPNGEAREEASIDKAMRLRKELTEGPDAKAVNELMTDATQAGMSVIDPSRNSHVRSEEQIRTQEALQARFDALDPRAKQTYREVNEYHNELYRAEREAAVKDFVERSFPDLTSAEHNVIREQMRTRQGVEDVLARADATPVARMMGQRWAAKSDLVKLIAESQKAGFVDGDYFPLRRHGEYIVSAGEHGQPNYLVQMFETASAARNFRADLAATRNDVSQVFVKSKTKPQDLAPQQALSTLDRAMERAGLTGMAADVLRDMYAGQLIQQGTRAATRTMKREGIAGASTDQARNLLVDFLAHTARIGHLTHGGEAVRTLYQVDREVQGLRGPNRGPTSTVASARDVAIAQTGAEELRRRMAPADGDVSADWAGRGTRGLTTLTVLNTLMRPAHFFMQLAGTHIAATSMIAARHNLAAVGAVNRAFAQLTGTAAGAAGRNGMAAWHRELKAANWILSDLYRERLKRAGSGIAADHVDLLIDRLNQAGLIDHTKMRELQRMAGPQGFGGRGINFISRFLDVAGAGEHALDSAMRVGTAKAAFELELRKNGGHVNGALDYAMQMARDSQPDYNFHNKSRLATAQGAAGRLAPIITQYKQFGLHMYGVQGNLLAAGIRNAAGSAERREAYKALALLQASHAVMYGGIAASVFGSLPVMFGMGLYDFITGGDRPSSATIAEAQTRNWVRDMTGSKTVADIFDKGVPMAFGADVHRSLQFTNLLGVPELKSFDKPGMMNLAVQVITGASGDTAAGMIESAGKIIGGDTRWETIAKMMPRVVRDPMEAVVWGQRGVTTPRGDLTVLPADRVTLGAQIAKGLGFIPPVVSDAREGRAVIQLAEKVSENTHGKILNRLVEAAPADRKGVIEEITRFNKENPADPITGQMIQQRLKQQAQINAQPGLYGVRGVAKRDIAARTDLARFANP